MIEPYKAIFEEIGPLLERVHFFKENESSFGSIYVRADGYRMTISIDRAGGGFSVDLEKVGTGVRGHLWPDALMEALEPSSGLKAIEVLSDGFNKNAILAWWQIFLTFLANQEAVVFRFPSSSKDPFWEAYVEIYNQKLKNEAMRSCQKIQ